MAGAIFISVSRVLSIVFLRLDVSRSRTVTQLLAHREREKGRENVENNEKIPRGVRTCFISISRVDTRKNKNAHVDVHVS